MSRPIPHHAGRARRGVIDAPLDNEGDLDMPMPTTTTAETVTNYLVSVYGQTREHAAVLIDTHAAIIERGVMLGSFPDYVGDEIAKAADIEVMINSDAWDAWVDDSEDEDDDI